MGQVRSADQADLLATINKGGEDAIKAVVLYCEDAHPDDFMDLFKQVIPSSERSLVKRVVFDGVVDGWDLYSAAVELEALGEVER